MAGLAGVEGGAKGLVDSDWRARGRADFYGVSRDELAEVFPEELPVPNETDETTDLELIEGDGTGEAVGRWAHIPPAATAVKSSIHPL